MATVTFRTDERTDGDPRVLQEASGASRTDVIGDALHHAASIVRAERIRQQSLALAADPEDRRAVAEAIADMAELRAWRPVPRTSRT